MRNLETVLQELYDSEINVSITSFWDGGFTIKLGDEANGFKAEANQDKIEYAGEILHCLAEQYYPDSYYVKNIWHPISTVPKDGTLVRLNGGNYACNTQLHNFPLDEDCAPFISKFDEEHYFKRDGMEFWTPIVSDEPIQVRNPTHWRKA